MVFSKGNAAYQISDAHDQIIGDTYTSLCNDISDNFSRYYGDFISLVLRDIPGVIVPIQRIWQNPYLKQIINIPDYGYSPEIKELLQNTKDSIARFFLAYKHLQQNGFTDTKIDLFTCEFGNQSILFKALTQYQMVKTGVIQYAADAKKIYDYFEKKGNIYRFLDRPHSNLLFDVLINQLAYPFHCNTNMIRRYKYKAKSTHMYTDLTVYDECRYIYEWLPALHQISTAFANRSYQYIFRFALDGLVKSRQLYNNEFFYQGSVVPDTIDDFLPHKMAVRKEI